MGQERWRVLTMININNTVGHQISDNSVLWKNQETNILRRRRVMKKNYEEHTDWRRLYKGYFTFFSPKCE